MHWFIKRGFVQADPDWLPEARKRKLQLGPRVQPVLSGTQLVNV
jgi:amino-acid N-acetyltransferase